MKTTTILIGFLLCFAFVIKAQTTIEEYNYLTKGYKVQIESGLDMKKGYTLEDVDQTKSGERSASLKALYKVTGAQKKIAGYLVIYKREGLASEYICIPSPNSEADVTKLYWTALYPGSGDSSFRLQLISYLLSKSMKW